MKKVVRKKKGVTLIAVLMVTAIVSTVVTAMVGMISTSYKARTQESKRLQNMYESDSALDVVYNIINRTSRAAILKAINQNDVKEEKDEAKQNTIFKQKFISYLVNGVDVLNPDKSKLDSSILEWTFPIYNDDGTISYEKLSDNDVELEIMDPLLVKDGASGKDTITGEEQIKVRVRSTFKSKNSTFENAKVLEANYIVTAPEYKEIQIEKSVDININPVYENKVITADGDLTSTGTLTLNGDVWVKGTKEKLTKDDKYSGGITFNDADVMVKSNIYTSNTLTINNTSNVQFEGNIYSSNTYLSEDINKAAEGKTELIATNDSEGGKLVTFNDLVLNATNGKVALNTYFGINDVSNILSASEQMNLAQNKSSSIIVNNLKSTLTIDKDAYIRGVAYLDNNVSEEYKTGESIAVKGNYVAYTDPNGAKDVIMKYYSPLQLIEYLNGTKFDLAEKEEHFVKYYQNKDVSTAEGIYLGKNVYSAGAIVKGDGAAKEVLSSNQSNLTDAQIETNVDAEKEEFALNVMAMGDLYDMGTKRSLYNEWVNNGVLKNTSARTVSSQINFDKIKNNEEVNDFFGKLILNKDGKKITISEGKITIGDKSIELDKTDMRALIVTNGDVEFVGGKEEFNFTGNIITTKNVIISGTSSNITLNYDEDVTTKIYASNKEYLDTIFQKFSDKIVNISLLDALSGTISDYNENEYLRKGQWKIIE